MKKALILFLLFMVFGARAQVIPVGFMKTTRIPTGTNPVTDNLLLYLDATRTASYGGTGETWTDISGQLTSNNATLYGNPTFESGSFMFADDKYALTSTLITSSLSAATFIAWVNPSQLQGIYSGIIYSRQGKGNATGLEAGLNFYTYNNVKNLIGYAWNGDHTSWNSNLQVPISSWSMIAITISSTEAVAYLCNSNGISSATNTASHGSASGLNFFIGNDPIFGTALRAYKGKIATSMVYSSALTQPNIESIFNAQKAAFGLAPIAVGNSYGGGKVFYIFQSGDQGYVAGETHGLIAALADASTAIQWAPNDITTNTSNKAIGYGLSNTNAIISALGTTASYAARTARNYNGGGYTDWYLPTLEELYQLIQMKTTIGASSFTNYQYFSSTESLNTGSDGRYAYKVENGTRYETNRSNMYGVRPVRSF
jgi:hypothetical protein